jgi:hypothetical protein
MTLEYNLTVDNLTDGFLQSLRDHYPHANLEIRVSPPQQFEGLTESVFWQIIADFDWSNADDDEAVVAKAVQNLAARPIRHVYDFQDLLSVKLFALDTRQHAAETGENAWLGADSDFSVDEFLYARCCCVANGKAFYEQVLKQPELMPKDLSFEALLTVAHKAYHLKTGKQFRYTPSHNIETFANQAGWRS